MDSSTDSSYGLADAKRGSALFAMDTKSHEELHSNAMGIAWMAGPLSSVAQYMDDATIATLCGSHLRFTCAGIQHSEIFSPKARGVSTLATNGADLFAVSETCLRPAVVVYQYPELTETGRLEDGAELEYLCVVFAPSSERLAAISGVPDHTVFLWDLSSQVMIAKLQTSYATAPQLSFCDLNTPHLALTSEVGVTVIQMEHFGTEWGLTPRTAPLDRVRAHCWAMDGDLYCTQRDRIYQVSIDTMEVAELDCDVWEAGTIVSVMLSARGIFAAMDDGRIQLCEPVGGRWTARTVADMAVPVRAMRPSPSYNFIVITCRTGQVRLLYTPSFDHKALEGYELDSPPAVDVCPVAPTYEHVASVHDPHVLRVWSSGGQYEAAVELVGRVTCVVSCITLPCVIVGNDESRLFAVDLVLPRSPRVVWTARVSQESVTSVTVSRSGRVGVVTTADGAVHLISTQPSVGFKVLALVETDGRAVAVDTVQGVADDGTEQDLVALLVTSNAELLSFVRVLVVRDCVVTNAVTYGLDTMYAGLSLHCPPPPSSGLATLTAPNTSEPAARAEPLLRLMVYTVAVRDRSLCQFTLRGPEQLLSEGVSDLLWRPDMSCASGHELRAVLLRMVGLFVLSAADDGMVRGRHSNLADQDTGPLSGRHQRATHQAISGGVRAFAVRPNGKEAAVVGFDGTLLYLTLPYSKHTTANRRRSTYFDDPNVVPETNYFSELPTLSNWDLMKDQPTWQEMASEQAWREHEEELMATREKIIEGVQTLREKVKEMLDNNAEMEQMDQLPENEFELDLDEQARLEEASELRVQEARNKIIDRNARNMYVRDQLKKQCWNSMEVKGKALQGLMQELEVANYPLVERCDNLLIVLEGIQERRQLEVAERRLEAAILERPAGGPLSSPSSLHRLSLSATPSVTPSATPSQMVTSGGGSGGVGGGGGGGGGDTEDAEEDDDAPPALPPHMGSLSHQLGVTDPWLLPQFEITSRKQRVEQVYMLREIIYQLKVKFNARFEEVYHSKTVEMERVRTWGGRLAHIYSELDMSETPWIPEWTAVEQPETLLTVKDEEVLVERYYTPAERARMEAHAAELERRRREREANDFRERAIQKMMNGVLEVRWEDTLKVDVPRPEFMDNKDQEDWTEEEVKAAAEYEQKVAALEEDREKYRKMLEQELKKLLVTVQEAVDKFDDSVSQLFSLKMQTEHAIYQEELKVKRLLRDIAEEDHCEMREVELCRKMDETQQRKVSLQAAGADLRRALEASRAGHEPLLQQEKLLDRSFKKEFPDTPSHVVDVLYRYFKRRPAALRLYLERAGRQPIAAQEEGVIELDHRRPHHGRRTSRPRKQSRHGSRGQSMSAQPGGGGHEQAVPARPTVPAKITGYSHVMHAGTPYVSKTVPGKRTIIEAMKELDDNANRSEVLEPQLWHKMCRLRLEKVLMEFEVLRYSGELAALVDSIEKRRHAEEALAQRTQQLISELAELREQRLRQLHDQEIQLVVKQGQVEVDMGDFCPNFEGAALIDRSKVELLNRQIMGIGEKKLEVMRDALRFRRGIVLQRWEFDRSKMMLEDLVQKLKDVDFMKVTRGIQQHLATGGEITEKNVARLNRRLEILDADAGRKQAEDAEVADYLERLMRSKRLNNQRLSLEARELNVDVSERELLYDIRCNHQSKWQARERLNNLRKIRDLCDVASFQQRYMAMLHGEMQRTYNKTFPILHAA